MNEAPRKGIGCDTEQQKQRPRAALMYKRAPSLFCGYSPTPISAQLKSHFLFLYIYIFYYCCFFTIVLFLSSCLGRAFTPLEMFCLNVIFASSLFECSTEGLPYCSAHEELNPTDPQNSEIYRETLLLQILQTHGHAD